MYDVRFSLGTFAKTCPRHQKTCNIIEKSGTGSAAGCWGITVKLIGPNLIKIHSTVAYIWIVLFAICCCDI